MDEAKQKPAASNEPKKPSPLEAVKQKLIKQGALVRKEK